MALIGNILLTLNSAIALLFGTVGLVFLSRFSSVNQNVTTDDGGRIFITHGRLIITSASEDILKIIDTNAYLPMIIFILVLTLLAIFAVNLFTWFAFAKMEGPHGRGWKIYLLIIGILNIGTLFSGVFFILAFALKSKNKLNENPSGN